MAADSGQADDTGGPTADGLARAWRNGEVAQVYEAAGALTAREPGNALAWFYFACAAAERNERRAAWSALERARDLDPSHIPTRRFLATLWRKAGEGDKAIAEIVEALAAWPAAPALLGDLDGLTRAFGQRALYQRSVAAALSQAPEEPALSRLAGFAAQEQGDPARARQCFQASLQARPTDRALYREIARTYWAEGDLARAEEILQAAVSRHPDDAQAIADLATTQEKRGKLAAAEATLAQLDEQGGAGQAVRLQRARVNFRLNRLDRAREQIDRIDWAAQGGQANADFYFLAGDVYRACGEVDAAMGFYDRANALRRQNQTDPAKDKRHYLDLVENSLRRFDAAFVRAWPAPDASQREPDPIFFVGFPRSGTTLLETALDAHPDITVVEEKPTAQRVARIVRGQTGGYPDAIAHAAEADLAALRQRYFAERAQHLPHRPGRIIVDKNPQTTLHLGVLYRLFPGMRVIFGLRHPADAVLSCYMQSFQSNPAMNNFYRLDEAAHLYDRLMTLWRQYLALLPLRRLVVPYEATIADFDTALGEVLAFLGTEWDDAIRQYRDRARTNPGIRTPSRWQVAQPIYTQARYRWQAYRHHLSHVLDNLLAWAEWHGYRHHDDGSVTAPGLMRSDGAAPTADGAHL